MKKRAMKKWIPRGCYCYDKNGGCKWLHCLGVKEHEDYKTVIMKCDYLGIIDEEEETLLWDSCKECDAHDNWRDYWKRRRK